MQYAGYHRRRNLRLTHQTALSNQLALYDAVYRQQRATQEAVRQLHPLTPPLKTAAEVRAEFESKGIAIAGWARRHGFSKSLVYEVLAGRKKCHSGLSHRVAVRLGMKAGEIVE